MERDQETKNRWIFLYLKIIPIGCTETSVRNDHYTLRYIQKREDLIYFTVEALSHIIVRLCGHGNERCGYIKCAIFHV